MMDQRSVRRLCFACALAVGVWLGVVGTVFLFGDGSGVLQMARLGPLAQHLNVLVAIVGVLLVLYQIRKSTAELSEDRKCDAVRLVTDWLATPEARSVRRALFSQTTVTVAIEGENLTENVGAVWRQLENQPYRDAIETACAQLDRVGWYLQTLRPDARAAVVEIYAAIVVRCWAVIAPHLRILRGGRGPQYCAGLAWLAREAMDTLRARGVADVRFHLSNDVKESVKIPLVNLAKYEVPAMRPWDQPV